MLSNYLDFSQSYGYDQQDDIVGQFANFGLKGLIVH